MHTDSPESQFRGLRWAAWNILVLLSLTDWSVAGCGVLMLTCEHVNNNVSGLKMSSKRSPSCRVRVSWSFWRKNGLPSHFVTLCWVFSPLSLSDPLFFHHHALWLRLTASFIHVYSVIHAPHSEIITSHKLWTWYHLHTYRISYSFVLGCFPFFLPVIALRRVGDTVITDVIRRTLYSPRQQKTRSAMWLLPQG